MNLLERIKTEVLVYDCTFKLSEETHKKSLDKILCFSNAMNAKGQSKKHYENERNAVNALNNIRIGKYGELAVAVFLYKNGYPKIVPDMTVRYGASKGWDCDLPYKELDDTLPDIHVKTCDVNTTKYLKSNGRTDNYSWTFQFGNKSGKGGKDILFSTPDSTEVIFLSVISNINNPNVTVYASGPWCKLYPILKDPMLDYLVGFKKCIYSNDLLSISKSVTLELN